MNSAIFSFDFFAAKKSRLLALLTTIALSFLFLFLPLGAKAAIIESGPPIPGIPESVTVGGGSILPLVKFMLSQSSGADRLTKVGFILRASSTMTSPAEISGVGLYRESGTRPDFQPNEDILLPGAYIANPATSTLIVLQPSGGYQITGNQEFYIVASTSALSNIVNGDAFDIQLQSNYASTTAGGVGTAYMAPPNKITLKQFIPVKISEVKAGTATNDRDEYVELYNPNPFYIDLQTAGLALHTFNAAGGAANRPITFFEQTKIIPKFSFFLLASQTNYSGSVPPDATFDNLSANFFIANGGLSIATSSDAAFATSTSVDMVGWGSQPAANCENSDTIADPCAPALLENNTTLERIAQGYPNATSTANSMAPNGPDYLKGNGVDRNDNSAEFVVQSNFVPQNTFSPEEFPFGGGAQDSSAPMVVGSWPGDNMTNVPIDISYIGFGFNEPIATSTLVSAAATSTVTLTAAGSSVNLCSSVSYNPNPGSYEPPAKCNLSANLSPNTVYTFTATSTIYDFQGNALDQDPFTPGNQPYQISFTTGGSNQTITVVTPPQVIGSMPFPGSYNIPTNISRFFIAFSQAMDPSSLNATNINLYKYSSGVKSDVSLSSASFSYNASTSVLTISSLPALEDNTHYEIEIDGQDSSSDTAGVKSVNNILMPMPSLVIPFDTGSPDTTGPGVLGVMPIQPGAANVPLNNINFTVVFDDHIDVSTATSGAATLGIQGGSLVPTSVSYNPMAKELSVTASNLLPANQTMVLTVNKAIKNISGIAMGSDYTMTFSTEPSNSDNIPPSIAFVNADEFGIAVTFDEHVNSTDAAKLSNYSISVGGQNVSLSAMAGHTITYNASSRTAKISGLHFASGDSFTVTASNIRDIVGNQMVSSSASGTVMSASDSGGFIEPGTASGSGEPPPPVEFTSGGGGGGFMPPANIMVMNNFTNASTTYGFEIPIASQIPQNGKIVIAFPSNSDFGLCCVATSSQTMIMLNEMNRDINGPGPGTIGIKAIAANQQAKTITLTLDAATRSESGDTHDFLRFGLTNIKNPSIPKGPDSSGYNLDIKTKSADGSTVLESNFNVNPVYIGGGNFGGAATTTIQGRLISGYDGTTGLEGVSVMLNSPILGPMPRSVTTSGSGNFSFENLPINNDYYLFTEPIVSPSATTTKYFGLMEPSPIRATSTDVITKNIVLTATSSAVNFDVKLTVSANTFSSSEKIDVFAGGPGQFVVETVTPGAGALTDSTIATLAIPKQNGLWSIGIGPAMPKDGMMMGPPPSPNWVMPKPLDLNMSGCPSSCSLTLAGSPITSHTFTILKSDKTIAGVVKDASGTTLTDAIVYAYSPSKMMGTQSQSDTAGRFSLAVVQGSYNVGAFFPGMGQSQEATVEVDSSGNVYVNGSKTASTGQTGANPFILTIKKPPYTITGRVSDGVNAVSNAPVFAYRTDGPGHADAMTDTSGNYTLYVDNGSWKVSARIPGYGQMSEQSVAISGANQSNINFAPSSATTYHNISGTVFESADSTIDSGEGISGVMVVAKRGSNFYDTKTGPDGAYTLRVPEAASGYTLELFKPGYGQIPSVDENLDAISAFGVSGDVTKNIRVNTRQPVTINIKDSAGNFVKVPEAFIDLFDIAKNFGNHAEIINGTSTTILIPNGASTTIRAFIPSVPPNSVSVASDSVDSLVIGDVLKVDGAEAVKIVINANLRTISGTVYHTSANSGNELKDAWIEVVDTSSGMHYGTSATSTNGSYSIKLADGSYKIMAVKPGYIMTPQSLTVSGDAVQDLVMTSALLSISGQITAGGSPAQNAFVRAEKVGGGFAVTQADADGNYSLSVDPGEWRIYAASDKYSEAAYSGNPLSVSSSQSGINIALTSAANVGDKLVTSSIFKDTAVGSFEDDTLKTKITIDSGGLGQSGSNSYIAVKETANFPDTPSVDVIAGKAKDINAYSGGSQVKNLSSGKKATVELTYTVAELASSGIDTPAEVSQLKISALNEQKEWESLNTIATYKDSNGNAVSVATTSSSIPSNVAEVAFTTSEATHFSLYALTKPSDPSAPNTPSGLAISVGEPGKLTASLTWNAVSGAEGYYVYRSTSSGGPYGLLATVSGTSYTDSGLSANTTYYYKVSSYKSGGSSESAASSAVSGTPEPLSGGGIISGGGGVIAPVVPPQETTESSVAAEQSTEAPAAELPEKPLEKAKPSSWAIAVSPVFNRTLRIGMSNSDVKRLQQLLNSDPDTRLAESGVGSPGNETNYFGPLTREAVKKFQKKYGIVSSGDEATTGYGLVGPKTRAKLREVFAEKPAVKAAEETAANQALISQIKSQIQSLQEQVLRLMQELQKLLQEKLKALQQ